MPCRCADPALGGATDVALAAGVAPEKMDPAGTHAGGASAGGAGPTTHGSEAPARAGAVLCA